MMAAARRAWGASGIGLLSIASGVAYTAGPRALGYLGFGDPFVLLEALARGRVGRRVEVGTLKAPLFVGWAGCRDGVW